MTNRKELLELFEEITGKALEIMKGKNDDYASEQDALANFRSSETLNVDPRKALLIRMLDKIKRQVNFIERGELSVDSAEDDIIDLINYSVLLHALNTEKEETVPKFCKTKGQCVFHVEGYGCSCQITNKSLGIDSAFDVDEGFDELYKQPYFPIIY